MAVQDHRIWAYFAERFGVDIVADLEPVPGIPPTSSHLTEVIELMRNRHVGIVLLSPYYDPRHAEFVSTNTGAEVVRMAHQVGSVDGASTYLAMIDYNVRQLAAAAAASKEQ
jgi:zinc/manganese transport system substrate-binding protein